MSAKAKMLDLYLDYLAQYQLKYGSKVAVLMMCGKFYEIYGSSIIYPGETKLLGNLVEISQDILNIAIAPGDRKKPLSRSNCEKAGFPVDSLERHQTVLLANGYYVVIINQRKNSKKEIIREVAEVVGPGTNTMTGRLNNYIVCLYFQQEPQRQQKPLCVAGAALIDVNIGKSFIAEFRSTPADPHYAMDECLRLIESYSPQEVVFIGKRFPSEQTLDQVVAKLGLDDVPVQQVDSTPEYLHVRFQNEYLGNYYPDTGMLTPLAYLDLADKQLAGRAFVGLLQYVEEQNPALLNQLSPPISHDAERLMQMPGNTIRQLNLVTQTDLTGTDLQNHRKLGSVVDVLSEYLQTKMGRRLLEQWVTRPLLVPEEIVERLNHSQLLSEHATAIHDQLRGVSDLNKHHRMIETMRLAPSHMLSLVDSYRKLKQMTTDLNLTKKIDCLNLNGLDSRIDQLINMIQSTFLLDRCSTYGSFRKLNGMIFRRGVFPELDTMADLLEHYPDYCQKLADRLIAIIGGRTNSIRVSLLTGCLTTSKNNYKLIQQKFNSTSFRLGEVEFVVGVGDLEVVGETKTTKKFQTAFSRKGSREWKEGSVELGEMVRDKYQQFLAELAAEHHETLSLISDLFAHLDIFQSQALMVERNQYSWPDILNEKSGESWFSGKDMRHPIVERLVSEIKYVSHSFGIGLQSERTSSPERSEVDGMILYGVNGVGKSVVMKTAGLLTVLSQSGLAVPAKSFRISPFAQVCTRIIGSDNMFKSQSTFEVEMSELRGILEKANRHTLVLADELCHGTEIPSAIGLVTASIIHFAQRSARFILATHIHQLSELPAVTALNRVASFHLSVHYDADQDSLVYDRKLRNGPGLSTYGIEVARALKLPINVINQALKIRSLVTKDNVSIKRSRYNADLYLCRCQICGQQATDTHHIQFQCTAVADKVPSGDHVHHLSNLVPLCKTCHQAVHRKEFHIDGYQTTTDGIRLKFNSICPTQSQSLLNELSTKTSIKPSIKPSIKTVVESNTFIKPSIKLRTFEPSIKHSIKPSIKPFIKPSAKPSVKPSFTFKIPRPKFGVRNMSMMM